MLQWSHKMRVSKNHSFVLGQQFCEWIWSTYIYCIARCLLVMFPHVGKACSHKISGCVSECTFSRRLGNSAYNGLMVELDTVYFSGETTNVAPIQVGSWCLQVREGVCMHVGWREWSSTHIAIGSIAKNFLQFWKLLKGISFYLHSYSKRDTKPCHKKRRDLSSWYFVFLVNCDITF